MPPLITRVLLAAFVLYAVFLLSGIGGRRFTRTFWLELAGLIGAFVVLRMSTGFPAIREPFSQIPSTLAVLVIFLSVVLGMVANYLFYVKGRFVWKSFVRPLLVSPIILLPLIGTVDLRSDIEAFQLFWLAMLAFQNGFFWRTVFEHAIPKAK